MRHRSWKVRLGRWLVGLEARAVGMRLAEHCRTCPRMCRNADLENCDEWSFCKEGRALFIEEFDLTMEAAGTTQAATVQRYRLNG